MPWPDRRDAGAALGLLALLIALFWRLVFRGEVLYDRDIAAVFHPMAESFFRAWRAGSLPLWNPWFSFGEPMLANPSAQVLYPPTWLMLAVPPATYYTLYVILDPAPNGDEKKIEVKGIYSEGKINDASAFAEFLKELQALFDVPPHALVRRGVAEGGGGSQRGHPAQVRGTRISR